MIDRPIILPSLSVMMSDRQGGITTKKMEIPPKTRHVIIGLPKYFVELL